MTTDIKPVAWRFRQVNAFNEPIPGWHYGEDAGSLGLRSPLYDQSAIDSLRAEVARLQSEIDNRWAQGVHTCHAECQRTACVLRRENGRLREALERIQIAHANDNIRPEAFYISAASLQERGDE